MKPTKKKPAKRGKSNRYGNDKYLDKLLKLKYLINDAYKLRGMNTKKDKAWVMRLIQDTKGGIVVEKKQLVYANELWRKYK